MPFGDIDIAIIGAGAAGLAAARALEKSGRSVLVLEARNRIGGRSRTLILPDDIVFDVGCGWLHSADKNSFVAVAQQLNFEIAKERPPWQEQAFDVGFPRAERTKFYEALEAFYDRLEQAAER
jgi:monoamine oxidase